MKRFVHDGMLGYLDVQFVPLWIQELNKRLTCLFLLRIDTQEAANEASQFKPKLQTSQVDRKRI